MTKPCLCPVYDPDCRRAGRPMSLRDYELCSGRARSEYPVTAELSEKFRAFWDGEIPPTPPSAPLPEQKKPLPCLHLGEPTGEVQECLECQGTVRLKLYACAVHGVCTLAKRLPGIAGCPCPDYLPKPEEP